MSSLRKELHLNRPLIVRYGNWLAGAVHGDLGQSAVALANGSPEASVSGLIGTPLRNSLVLAVVTIILLIPLSLLVGTAAAVRAGRATDYAVSYSSLVLGSLPEFVLGTFLIVIFFSGLNLLPPVALVPPGRARSRINALILPVLTLLGVSLAFSARQVRAGVIEALRQDYVTMARLSGLPERRVLWRYALRNALAPSVQTFAQTSSICSAGSSSSRRCSPIPGSAQLLVQAVSARDVTRSRGSRSCSPSIYIAINIARRPDRRVPRAQAADGPAMSAVERRARPSSQARRRRCAGRCSCARAQGIVGLTCCLRRRASR